MRRGDVYWYIFDPPDKKRPVLILTRSEAIAYLNAVTVAPITSTIREIPSEVYLDEEEGLLNPCVANFDNIITVPKRLLGERLTQLELGKMLAVDEAIKYALGCVL